MLTVRRMYANDLDQICWSGGRRHLGIVNTALMRSDTVFLLALHNDRAVSMGAVTYNEESQAGIIRFLHTEPRHEGEGYATAVMFNLETLIAEHGYSYSDLYVERTNNRAISLYQYLGYGIVGEENPPLDDEEVEFSSAYGAVVHYRMRKNLRTVQPSLMVD